MFRLKQLYEKFDEVIASGRMITRAADSTDDGKKKFFNINDIGLYRHPQNILFTINQNGRSYLYYIKSVIEGVRYIHTYMM